MNKNGKLHICFIVGGYPTPEDPFMPFIKNTVAEMAKQGVKCTVIAPQSITRAVIHKVPIRPVKWIDKVDDHSTIVVLQPKYFSLSGRAQTVNQFLFCAAAKTAYKEIEQEPDALYGHFWHMGVVASQIDHNKPLFIACGESKITVRNEYKNREIVKMKEQLTGVIYVSTKSYNESIELGLQMDTPYIIAPNAYDALLFSHKNRRECRKKLGWPEDEFVVAFVGAFIARKGTQRLSNALTQINKAFPVYSCFIGSGDEQPTCPNVLFSGKVSHEKIASYLNASDIFVLPTTNEGCCNAIIEAMACGLPVISSDGAFNDDILHEDNSIRVNSMDETAIKEAIIELYNDSEKRASMESASLRISEGLTLPSRIHKMIDFMRNNL